MFSNELAVKLVCECRVFLLGLFYRHFLNGDCCTACSINGVLFGATIAQIIISEKETEIESFIRFYDDDI